MEHGLRAALGFASVRHGETDRNNLPVVRPRVTDTFLPPREKCQLRPRDTQQPKTMERRETDVEVLASEFRFGGGGERARGGSSSSSFVNLACLLPHCRAIVREAQRGGGS